MDLTQNFSYRVCQRLKKIYLDDTDWVESYRQVGNKFSRLRQNMVIFYPLLSVEEGMRTVYGLGDHDLKEMVEFKSECST